MMMYWPYPCFVPPSCPKLLRVWGCHVGTKHGPFGKERRQTLIITCSWFQIQTMGTPAGLHGWDTLERMVKLSPRAIETANAVFRVLSAMPSYRNRPQRVDMPIIWPTYIYIQNICTHMVVSFSVLVEGVISQLWKYNTHHMNLDDFEQNLYMPIPIFSGISDSNFRWGPNPSGVG